MANVLNLTCVMKLSKILKKLGIKKYIKELLSENVETMLQEVKKISEKEESSENSEKDIVEKDEVSIKREEKKEEVLRTQQLIIATDVFAWIFENIGEAESEFYELFQIYSGEHEKAVRNWDIDKTLEVFNEMFVNGIPKVLKNLIGVDEIKKKLSTMMQ